MEGFANNGIENHDIILFNENEELNKLEIFITKWDSTDLIGKIVIDFKELEKIKKDFDKSL